MPIILIVAGLIVAFAVFTSYKSAYGSIIVIKTTFGSKELASSFAKIAVQNKLAACASLYQQESHYTWNGTLCKNDEYALELKTIQKKQGALIAAILKNHSFKNPQIIITTTKAHLSYHKWMIDMLS